MEDETLKYSPKIVINNLISEFVRNLKSILHIRSLKQCWFGFIMNEIHDKNTTISFFKEGVKEFIKERDWLKYHTPKNLVQAINSEAGELSQLLLFREYTKDDICSDKKLFNNISEEIADVFIYLISLINALDLDLTQVFIDKMKKNKNKYSTKEFKNGIYYKK